MSYTSVSSPTARSTSLLSRSRASSRLRYEREKGARSFSTLSLPQLLLGSMAVCAGIITVYVGSLSPAFPFVTGTDILSGLTTVFAGGLAYKISKENTEPKTLRSQVRCNMFLYGFLTILCLCLSFLSIGAAGYGTHLCTMDVTTEEMKLKESHPCQTRRRATLALSITDIVLECFICVINVVGFWVFANYRFAFGCFTSCDASTQKAGYTKRKKKKMIGSSTRQTVSSVDSSRLASYTNLKSGMALPNHIPGGMTFTRMYDDIDRFSFDRQAQSSGSERDVSRYPLDSPTFSLIRAAQRNSRSDRDVSSYSIDSTNFILDRPAQRSRSDKDVSWYSVEKKPSRSYVDLDSSKYSLDGMTSSHLQSDVDSRQSSDRRGQYSYGAAQYTITNSSQNNFRNYKHKNAHSYDSNNVSKYIEGPSHRAKTSALDTSDTLYNGQYSLWSISPLAYADSETLY